MTQSTRAISTRAARRDQQHPEVPDQPEVRAIPLRAMLVCRVCGGPVPSGRRRSCSPECERAYQREYQRQFHADRRRRLRVARPPADDNGDTALPSTLYGPNRAGVMVAGGFGISVHVADAHLVIRSRDEGEVRLPRVSSLRRLIVVGTSGRVSLLALWWCREVGATVTLTEPSGRLLTMTGPEGRNDTRLRRAQALAPWTPAGLTLARSLNVHKLAGYLELLAALPSTDRTTVATLTVRTAMSRLKRATSIAEVRLLEMDAAIPYHSALSITPMHWRATESVPSHWRTLGDRGSRLSSSARAATSPGQALRNFIGGLAACEIVAACRAIGLDPGLGIGLHDDVRGRQSLAWEVMEGLRPTLDQLTLRILASRVWRRGDFHELASGEVRLRPDWPAVKPDAVSKARSLVAEVTRLLLDELRRTGAVAHLVEEVATVVANHALAPPGSRKTTAVNVPTVLTESRRTAARREEHAGLPASPAKIGERNPAT